MHYARLFYSIDKYQILSRLIKTKNMTQTIHSLPVTAKTFCHLENFEQDKNGPVPFDGTEGPYCLVTGEADLILLNHLMEPHTTSARYKVAVKVQCGANEKISDGIYFTKVFKDIVYLVKRFA
jgi:hypothetical protein